MHSERRDRGGIEFRPTVVSRNRGPSLLASCSLSVVASGAERAKTCSLGYHTYLRCLLVIPALCSRHARGLSLHTSSSGLPVDAHHPEQEPPGSVSCFPPRNGSEYALCVPASKRFLRPIDKNSQSYPRETGDVPAMHAEVSCQQHEAGQHGRSWEGAGQACSGVPCPKDNGWELS